MSETVRGRWTRWLAYALMAVLAFGMFYALMQRPSSDLSIHAAWASEGSFTQPKTFFRHAAHPLWHVLVVIGLRLGLTL